MKPEKYSKILLGMTRSKAKMYEYSVPLASHINIELEEIIKLFPLTIGLLGDFSAKFYTTDDTSAVNDLREELMFSAHFWDSYFNSQLHQENDGYYLLLGSAAYYLCDLPGSATVLSAKLDSDTLNLASNKLDKLLLCFLKKDFLSVNEDGPYGEYINKILKNWGLFISTGSGEKELFKIIDNLREDIYANGTSRELLFVDIISAVIKKKFLNSTWHSLPLYSDLPLELWQPILIKNNFIKELWQSQHLLGEKDILKGKSATIQMPTSAGKTKATELIIRSAFLSDRTNLAVIVAPFRALCHDIKNDLTKAFANENVNIDELTDVYQNDFDFNDVENDGQIIILTPEKLLYIIRQTPELAEKIGLIIYDEGHQFDSPARGTNYELLLSSLKLMIPDKCQTILISAVLSNIEDINQWLNEDNSEIIQGNNLTPTYRTVAFTSWKDQLGRVEFVNIDNPDQQEFFVPRVIGQETLQLMGRERNLRYFPNKDDHSSISLYMGLKLVNQGSVAIFCGRKNSVPKLCEDIVEAYKRKLSLEKPIIYSDDEEIQKIYSLYAENLGAECNLTKAAQVGILSHYSNIPQGIRLSVEHAMKISKAKFIICTSTLAQGVNLPLRYLIVSSTQQGRDSISTRDFQNLIGRAGRAGMYTEGSIIFANNSLFDKRMYPKEKWRWENTKEILKLQNMEKCNSNLFKIFEPIHNEHPWGSYRYKIEMEPLNFTQHYINETVEKLISEILEHEIVMKNGQDIGFKKNIVEEQCVEKINIIKNIEGFILSQIDLDNNTEEKIEILAKSTLAYHLGDTNQKAQLIELFKLLAENIKNKIPEDYRRKYFSKTLYGINTSIELEKWIKENIEALIKAKEITCFVNLISPIFSKTINNKFFERCNSQTALGKTIVDWVNGKPFYELLNYLVQNNICLKTPKQNKYFTIDDVVDFCENTLAYDGSLFIGTLIEIIQGMYDEIQSDFIEDLKLKQKMIKYGLNNHIAVNIYELGFADRTIAQDLARIINTVTLRYGNKKEIKKIFKRSKKTIKNHLAKYPSYFTEKLELL